MSRTGLKPADGWASTREWWICVGAEDRALQHAATTRRCCYVMSGGSDTWHLIGASRHRCESLRLVAIDHPTISHPNHTGLPHPAAASPTRESSTGASSNRSL